jgi:hypothetical protein
MWRWLRSMTSPKPGPSVLRPVVTPSGDPYREDLGARPMERTVDPCTLDELRAALLAAGVSFRPRRRGFDVVGRGRSRVMPVRIRDPERIIPTELGCGTDAPELLLDLALALVPLFGPLLADVRFAGTMFVDGKRDRRALGEEAALRLQSIGLRLARRAPISFPILVDLARRLRQPL